MASSQELLSELLEAGWTKSGIAKKLGINSSTLSQVEKGSKPARNLEAPLQDLKQGKEPGERQKRQTKSGEPAKVRQPKKLTEKRIVKTKDGRIKIAQPTSLPYVAKNRLATISSDGGKVSIRCRIDRGQGKGLQEAVLYSRGGEYAARLEHRWAVFEDQNPDKDFFDLVVELFNEIIKNFDGVSEPISREMLKAVGYAVIYPDLMEAEKEAAKKSA